MPIVKEINLKCSECQRENIPLRYFELNHYSCQRCIVLAFQEFAQQQAIKISKKHSKLLWCNLEEFSQTILENKTNFAEALQVFTDPQIIGELEKRVRKQTIKLYMVDQESLSVEGKEEKFTFVSYLPLEKKGENHE